MVDEINANFYRAFEEKHRGTRDLIKSRLRVYLPFIEPLRGFIGADKAVDLGCGRGEWLELLQEAGFDALGVDLDDGMLAACRKRKLKVQTGDAIAFLKGLPAASQAVVSGFHLAEHIPFADLQVLVAEALRVLMPGGLLILETPNPENIVVGATKFYLDPTHQRPIPPDLLSFLPEYCGFKKVKTLRLQESVELSRDKVPTLLDVLDGVSPDCAVVAQKGAEPEQMNLFNTAFEKNYGLSLETLSQRFEVRIVTAEAMARQAEERAQRAEADLNRIKNFWVWRLVKYFRRLVYQKILGPFPLLQKSALTISREGFSVFYHKTKIRLINYLWHINLCKVSKADPLKTMAAKTYVRLSDFQMKADREVIRKKLRAINEEIKKKRGV